LIAIAYAAYMLVSMVAYGLASLYAAIAAGVVVGFWANPRQAPAVAAIAASLGALSFMLYYALHAPEETAIMLAKLGLIALLPLLYSAAVSALAAFLTAILRGRRG
jgi:hypothetical protein